MKKAYDQTDTPIQSSLRVFDASMVYGSITVSTSSLSVFRVIWPKEKKIDNKELTRKLDSLKDEQGTVCNDSQHARDFLRSLMKK